MRTGASAALLLVALAPALGAQVPEGAARPEVFEGKIVHKLTVNGAASPESLTRYLRTRVGEPLRAADVVEDQLTLWRQPRVIVLEVWAEPEGDGVALTFEVLEPHSYDRHVFKGLRKFTETEARDLIGLRPTQRVTDYDAADHQRILEARYRREGYAHARVLLERDDETSTLTFVVDEGPKVTVRNVSFRGNIAFPGWAPLGLYPNLLGGADVESSPAGRILPGAAYSDDLVEEDLERLRLFYRARGYRDAQVELAAANFTPDRSEVDLIFRVVEGRRYRLRSIDVVHVRDGAPDPKPLYPKERLLPLLSAKPGDHYDRETINRDKRQIERFYGERGHPVQGRYNRAKLPGAFEWHNGDWQQPRETFHPDTAEIDVVYQVVEGAPKLLRGVVIRGNTDTQDRVVRRKVQVKPGERLDLNKIDRSLQLLGSLRYFQDQETLQGPRFELLPVADDPEQVDLEIQVEEGDTGSLIWGAGVSTAAGVQARIQVDKRNFDLFRLPSSAAPGTIIHELINNKAFHGAGQELELLLAPGTEITTASISFYEPDLFGDHEDTIGLRVQAFRRIRILDSFDSDSLGLVVGLQRNFTDNFSVGVGLREEVVDIENIDANAPTIVWESEGSTEIRSFKVQGTVRDLDHLIQPSSGYEVQLDGEVAGGILGGEADFWTTGASLRTYFPLYRDALERVHVLHVGQGFDYGAGYGDDDDLFLTERFYMGGSTLRGFDQRRAGPTQFGRPLGGEARWLSRVEYQFPLVSTRLDRAWREVELVRGVLFTDMGLLGTRIDDPTFRELRLSVGLGVRIHVPILGVPIALDLGFPVMYEQTDERQVLFFTLSKG